MRFIFFDFLTDLDRSFKKIINAIFIKDKYVLSYFLRLNFFKWSCTTFVYVGLNLFNAIFT